VAYRFQGSVDAGATFQKSLATTGRSYLSRSLGPAPLRGSAFSGTNQPRRSACMEWVHHHNSLPCLWSRGSGVDPSPRSERSSPGGGGATNNPWLRPRLLGNGSVRRGNVFFGSRTRQSLTRHAHCAHSRGRAFQRNNSNWASSITSAAAHAAADATPTTIGTSHSLPTIAASGWASAIRQIIREKLW
jgi:hypothetical protein